MASVLSLCEKFIAKCKEFSNIVKQDKADGKPWKYYNNSHLFFLYIFHIYSHYILCIDIHNYFDYNLFYKYYISNSLKLLNELINVYNLNNYDMDVFFAIYYLVVY